MIEIIALIFAVLAFAMSTFALIEVKAMQRSTHQVQYYNPVTDEFTTPAEGLRNDNAKELYDNI